MTIKKYFDLTKKVLYPINRSLTGEGIQKTLKIIKKEFPALKIRKILSGSKVYDWKVPPEWNVSEAYVADKYGNKIIDFKMNNLHLVSYSAPINKLFIKNAGDFALVTKKKLSLIKFIAHKINLKLLLDQSLILKVF